MKLTGLTLVAIALGIAAIPVPKAAAQSNSRDAKRVTTKAGVDGLGKYQQIIDRSPFRNKSVPQVAGAGSVQQLHFTGIIRIGDTVKIGLEDIVQRKSFLLTPGESKDGIEVQSVDEMNRTVVVNYNGKSMSLALESLPSQSAGGAAAPPNWQQPQQQPGTIQTGPPMTNQSPIQNRRMRIPRSQ